jgi:hypothetical protein
MRKEKGTMDQNRFDEMTRSLGQGRSRRHVLKALGAAAFGAVGLGKLGAADAASSTSNGACAKFCAQVFGADTKAAGQCTSQAAKGTGPCVACGGNAARYCHGVCVDLTTDAGNCGACGVSCGDANACTTDTCSGGHCVNTPIVLTCPATDACHTTGACDPATGQCTNPVAAAGTICAAAPDACHAASSCDATGHCLAGGALTGTACDSGAGSDSGTCQTGSCVANPVGCLAGQTTCNGTCTDLMTDEANCGACSHACSAGGACLDGACFLAFPACTGSYGVAANGGGVNACICGGSNGQVCTTTGDCPSGDVCILIPNGDGSYTGFCYGGCSA